MRKVIISLGGGCDAATVLECLRLRKKSYPFDWLWNLCDGLKSVELIIKSNFSNILERNDFIYAKHYRWKDEEKLVFRSYPNIIHLHSNPYENDEDLATFNRRINRFKDELNNGNEIYFIYYRSFSEAVIRFANASVESVLANLIEESESFCKTLNLTYPNKTFKLLSLIIFKSELNIDFNRINYTLKKSDKNKQIKYGYVYSQPEKDAINSWIKVLFDNGFINLWTIIKFYCSQSVKKVVKKFLKLIL
jgi:hypothetical protein